ncbi:ubiquitin C-terminal hydrolase Ubp14, partial [Linderina macrospora]
MQERPAQCLQCQVHKLAHGLWSGVYAHIEKDADGNVTQQTGVPPAQFKAAISKDHYEFSTMRQQDAFEFWQFLVKQIGVMERRASASGESTGSDPSHVFDFKTEERLQCLECNKVRYTVQPASSVSLPVPKRVSADGTLETVSLQECLEMLAGTETIDGYSCPECCRPTKAAKSTRFASFPRVLAVQARRFELVNWVPQKLDIPLAVPLAAVDLEQYRARGIQPDEQPLPEDSAGQTAASALAAEPTVADEPSAEDVAQLESMGFPRVRCIKALRKTANVEAALNWIFEHMDDPTIDVPDEPQQPSQQQQLTVDPETVAMLTSMGFAADRVERALASAD